MKRYAMMTRLVVAGFVAICVGHAVAKVGKRNVRSGHSPTPQRSINFADIASSSSLPMASRPSSREYGA
jgi:hypothetical protein